MIQIYRQTEKYDLVQSTFTEKQFHISILNKYLTCTFKPVLQFKLHEHLNGFGKKNIFGDHPKNSCNFSFFNKNSSIIMIKYSKIIYILITCTTRELNYEQALLKIK